MVSGWTKGFIMGEVQLKIHYWWMMIAISVWGQTFNSVKMLFNPIVNITYESS